MKILNELSLLNPHTDGNEHPAPSTSPELFKYPVAYLCEPGGWVMSDQEAAGLRTYLQKGGFVIVDDFRLQHWGNFEAQMSACCRRRGSSTSSCRNPIFHAFFEIKTLDVPQYYDPPPAIFRAIYEDNDPASGSW